jgi:hypothetical protein
MEASMNVTELQSLGDALGLQLVDEIPMLREKFEQLRTHPETAQKAAFLFPVVENMVDAAVSQASRDRTSVRGWHLAGSYNNVNVQVGASSSTLPDGEGGNGVIITGTLMKAFFQPSLQPGLRITHESLVSRIAQKVTGKHDIQTGNPELDKVIHVKAENEETVRSLLGDAELQEILLSSFTNRPWPIITDIDARLNHYASITQHDVIRKSLDLLTAIVTILSRRACDLGTTSVTGH